MMGYYGYGFPMMGFNPGGIISAIVGVLLIALIIIVIVRIAKHNDAKFENKKASAPADENPALKILNERYARGEISDEEYKTKKTNLQ